MVTRCLVFCITWVVVSQPDLPALPGVGSICQLFLQFLQLLTYLSTLQRGWVLPLAWIPWTSNLILSTNLPNDKMDSLLYLLSHWSLYWRCTIGQLQSLSSCLRCVAGVVWLGCAFIHSMVSLQRRALVCRVQGTLSHSGLSPCQRSSWFGQVVLFQWRSGS